MFSVTAEYALRAAVWLAQCEGPQTTAAIAEATQVPPDYLAKILRLLARAGMVRAARGPNGGFELQRHPSAINILDIVNVVDPIVRLKSCPLGLASHGRKLCPLHRKMDDALAVIEAAFCDTNLADLARSGDRHPLCEALA
jgi:Rrf2 family protein